MQKENIVKMLLLKLGYKLNHIGFYYLMDNVLMMVNKEQGLKAVQEHFYARIADTYGTNSKAVERELRWMVGRNWSVFEGTLLEKVVGCHVDKKPSNKELVCILSNHVICEMKNAR